MEQVLVITDATSSDPFAIITEKNGSLRFFGVSDAGKEWSLWVDAATNGRGHLEDIAKKLTLGLAADGPKPMTRKVRAQLAENLPKVSESTHEELTTGRVESKSLESGDAMSRVGMSQKQWNARINYKALSFTNDRNFSTISFDLKSARAVFDPNLAGGNGGWRCPVGTRYGGEITDRYGRGCGWGIARRIVNAVGDAARSAERRLEDRRKRRVDRRNRRIGRHLGLNKPDKPGRSHRGMATRLEDFADRRDRRQGRGLATRLEDFADRRDERQGVGRRNRRAADAAPVEARRRRTTDLVDEVAPQTARERRRSASVDRVNDQPAAAKKPATVPVAEQPRPAKKVVAKKRPAKKVPAKKAVAKKAPAKKAAAKKAVAKKAPAKKAAARQPRVVVIENPLGFAAFERNVNAEVANVNNIEERDALVRDFQKRENDLRQEAMRRAEEDAIGLRRRADALRRAAADLKAREFDAAPSARPAKKAAAKKASARKRVASRIPQMEDLNTEDQAWVQDRLGRRHGDDAARVQRRIADGANLNGDIRNQQRLIERMQGIVNDPQKSDRDRVLAAERINAHEANLREFQNALERNGEAVRPAKKVAAKKRAAKKAVASRNAATQEQRRLAKIENNLNDWVDQVADSKEREKVIEAYRQREQELLRLAAAVPSENESALEREAALYTAAIRRLRERDIPSAPQANPPAKKVAAKKRAARRGTPDFGDLNLEDRARVRNELEAIYGNGAARERENNAVIERESINQLENRIAFLQNEVIPSSRRKANDKNLPLDQRVFYAESVAIHQERIDAYRAGIQRHQELAAANALAGELSADKVARLEKEVAKRYANLRKKRGAIVGKWMIKTYGNENPPPWETDKNIKLDELQRLVRGNADDQARVREWVKQVYAIDEVVGRNGIRFRVKIADHQITMGGSRIDVAGDVQAFNPATQRWENVGTTRRNIFTTRGYVHNDRLTLGRQGGYNNPFAESIKNEGFTSVFNPHAFTWLKASGFKYADVSAAWDGQFVWARFGYRQELGPRAGANLADALMDEVSKYRQGHRDGLIRTDLDADLIEYLTKVARQKNFAVSAPQHPEYILALAGDKNFSEADKKAYDKKLKEWFISNAPFHNGEFYFTDENVPDDPRKLV